MDEVTIDGKVYISSKRAAEITGYAKDYVGQLCREGYIDAKMVGRGWYVLESSIRSHRFGSNGDDLNIAGQNEQDKQVDTINIISNKRDIEIETKSIYEAEKVIPLPVITPSVPKPLVIEKEESISHEENLSEMQKAWKEWFDSKNKTPIQQEVSNESVPKLDVQVIDINSRIEEALNIQVIEEDEPSIDDEVDVEDQVPQRAETEAEKPDEVSIQRIYVPVASIVAKASEPEPVVISERIIRKKKGISSGNKLLITILVILSVISIAFATIGSGIVNPPAILFGGNSSLYNFIKGETTIEN